MSNYFSSAGNIIFRDKNGKFLAMIVRDIPEELTKISDKVTPLFQAGIFNRNSKDKTYKYLAVHFDIYNRYPSVVCLV